MLSSRKRLSRKKKFRNRKSTGCFERGISKSIVETVWAISRREGKMTGIQSPGNIYAVKKIIIIQS